MQVYSSEEFFSPEKKTGASKCVIKPEIDDLHDQGPCKLLEKSNYQKPLGQKRHKKEKKVMWKLETSPFSS